MEMKFRHITGGSVSGNIVSTEYYSFSHEIALEKYSQEKITCPICQQTFIVTVYPSLGVIKDTWIAIRENIKTQWIIWIPATAVCAGLLYIADKFSSANFFILDLLKIILTVVTPFVVIAVFIMPFNHILGGLQIHMSLKGHDSLSFSSPLEDEMFKLKARIPYYKKRNMVKL